MRDLDALLDRDFERESISQVPSLVATPTAGTALADGEMSASFCRVVALCKPSEPVRAAEPIGDVAALCFRCGAPSVGVWHCPTGRHLNACAAHACCGNRCRHCSVWRST